VGELKGLLQKAQTQSMKFGVGGQEQLSPFGGVVSPFVGNGGTTGSSPMPVREDKVVDFDTEGHVLRVHVSRSIGAGSGFKPRGIRKKKKSDGSAGNKKSGCALLHELHELGLF